MNKGDKVRIQAIVRQHRPTAAEALRLSSEGRIIAAPLLLETLANNPHWNMTTYRDCKVFTRQELKAPIEGIFVGMTTRWSGYTTWGGYDDPNYFTSRDRYSLCMVVPLQVESCAYTYGGPNRGKITWFTRSGGDRYLKPVPVLPEDLEPI